MDPFECYNLMIEFYLLDEYETAKEAAEDLKEWFDKNGYCPQIDGIPEHEIKSMVNTVLSL